MDFKQRPLHIAVDPEFDIFRRLDREEIPPALSQAFGADNALILLPSKASKALQKAYEQLAIDWKNNVLDKVSIKYDSEINTLPKDKSIWLLGFENKDLSHDLQQYKVQINSPLFKLNNKLIDSRSDSVVLSGRNPQDLDHAIALIATANPDALPGLSRKLPHYRKYSYLTFIGSEPTVQLKGQWPVVNSPMQENISELSGPRENIVAPAEARSVLAKLPSIN